MERVRVIFDILCGMGNGFKLRCSLWHFGKLQTHNAVSDEVHNFHLLSESPFEHYPIERVWLNFESFCGLGNDFQLHCSLWHFGQLKTHNVVTDNTSPLCAGSLSLLSPLYFVRGLCIWTYLFLERKRDPNILREEEIVPLENHVRPLT